MRTKIFTLLLTLVIVFGALGSTSFAASKNPNLNATRYATSVSYMGTTYPITLVIFDTVADKASEKIKLSNFKYFCKVLNIQMTSQRVHVAGTDKAYSAVSKFVTSLLIGETNSNAVFALYKFSQTNLTQEALQQLAVSIDNSGKLSKAPLKGKTRISLFDNGGGIYSTPSVQWSNDLNAMGWGPNRHALNNDDRWTVLHEWVDNYTFAAAKDYIKAVAAVSLDYSTGKGSGLVEDGAKAIVKIVK